MRRFIRGAAVACALALTALPALAQAPVERAIDPAVSKATFSIQHIFVSRVVGTVPITGGSVTLVPGSAIPTAIVATLDPTRLRTDEPDRDASLESPDYFDVKRFPTWTFSGDRVTPTGPASFTVDGILTMHGVSRPETLAVVVRGDADHPLYHATATIDRRAFAMKGTRLDPVIGATADVTLDVGLR